MVERRRVVSGPRRSAPSPSGQSASTAIFASASEGFSRANLNATITESLERLAPVAQAAQADGVTHALILDVVNRR